MSQLAARDGRKVAGKFQTVRVRDALRLGTSRAPGKNGLAAGAGGVTVEPIMKRPKVILFTALLIATGVMLWIQHHSQEKMRAEIAALLEQNNSLVTANENLSNLVAQVNGSQAMSKKQLNELLKLRGEVGMLHSQVGQLEKMRTENQQLRSQASARQNQPVQLSAKDEFTLVRLHTVDTMKHLALCMRLYSNDHNNAFVTNFDQLTGAYYLTNNYPNNIATSAFEFVNVGTLTDDNPGMIMFREKQPRQMPDGGWERAYGLVDGSVHNDYSPDGNFDVYEKNNSPHPRGQ